MSRTFGLPESDQEDNSSEELERQIKTRIAWAYLNREIADNNPSLMNGLTSLEQVIWFEFPEIECDDIEDIEFDIIEIANHLERGYPVEEEYPSNDDKTLKRIAMGVFSERITDDNESQWSGLTSLEQILRYCYGDKIEEPELRELKKKIFGIILDLRGGFHIPGGGNLEDTRPLELF